jgi:hypothetical protein
MVCPGMANLHHCHLFQGVRKVHKNRGGYFSWPLPKSLAQDGQIDCLVYDTFELIQSIRLFLHISNLKLEVVKEW